MIGVSSPESRKSDTVTLFQKMALIAASDEEAGKKPYINTFQIVKNESCRGTARYLRSEKHEPAKLLAVRKSAELSPQT
jgi:hypothetical protein